MLWVVVDHDPEDFVHLRVPIRTAAGVLSAATIPIAPPPVAASVRAGLPPCLIPAFAPTDLTSAPLPAGATLALPHLPGHLGAVSAALRAAQQSMASQGRTGVAAEQFTLAGLALLHDLAGIAERDLAPLTIAYTSKLGQTDAFVMLVNHLGRTAAQAIPQYNSAIAAHPAAGRPLLADAKAGRYELPLWSIDPVSGLRKRLFATGTGGGGGTETAVSAGLPQQMAPRALLLTTLIRLLGCELFIHGTGGGSTLASAQHPAGLPGYDAAAELWARRWLGEALAPTAVVTADLHLPLAGTLTANLPASLAADLSPRAVAHARWVARSARFDPLAVSDRAAAAAKAAILAEIRAAPTRAERKAAFLRLHEHLTTYRARHADLFSRLDTHATTLAHAAAAAAITTDRTWPFPLHTPDTLAALWSSLRSSFN